MMQCTYHQDGSGHCHCSSIASGACGRQGQRWHNMTDRPKCARQPSTTAFNNSIVLGNCVLFQTTVIA